MYDNSVDAYTYYNILLWWRFSFMGRHQLLFLLGDPLDLSYLVYDMCWHIRQSHELNTRQMMGLTTKCEIRQKH